MKIEITINDDHLEEITPRIYNPEEDDIRSILIDVCRHTESNVDFNVSGFGHGRWPVDSGTDLPVFLEQLPETLNSIQTRRASNIDFYEQGIEMNLQFNYSEADDFYTIHCTHHADHKPNIEAIRMPAPELLKMLSDARDTFMEVITRISPKLNKHPWIEEWMNT